MANVTFDLRYETRVSADDSDDGHAAYLKANMTDASGSQNDLVMKYIREVSDVNILGIGNSSYNDMVKAYNDAVG